MDNSPTVSDLEQPSVEKLPPQTHRFTFHGDGFEYFKIWIVNILLTVLTLGIYSAWAKVRSKRYFYSNLELDNSRFDYLANPVAILKGRLIAVGVFILFGLLSNFYPAAYIVLSVLFFFAMPYLAIRSLMFNNRMSAYKNIQFRFKANYGEAFMVLFVWPLLGVLTLGILLPKSLLEMNRFVVKNSAYGTTKFDFTATYKDYAVIMLIAVAVTLGALVLMFGVKQISASLAVAAPVLMFVGYAAAFVYFSVSTLNLFYRSLVLADIRFDAQLCMVGFTKVHLINAFFTVITLGLYLPAAKVRMTKYVCSQLTMIADESLASFVAAEKTHVSAMGEEFADVFDIEVGAI